MRKVIFFVLLTVLLMSVIPAAADLIWTPRDEYLSHCYYGDMQGYIVTDPSGWTLRAAIPPEGNPEWIIENGTEILSEAVCGPEGDQWVWVKAMRRPGNSRFHNDDYGFLPLSALVKAYDSDLFLEQHKAEIQPFTDDPDICGMRPVSFMKYPGSGVEVYQVDEDDNTFCTAPAEVREAYGLDQVYTGTDGDRWVLAKLPYNFNFEYGWLNIGPAETEGN